MAAITKNILYRIKSNNYSTDKLFDSIFHGEGITTIQTLLQEGADIDARSSKGTPLLLACFCRRINIVKLLIKCGANVDCCDGNGYTVFHYAARYSWTTLVWFLVKKVLDLNVQDISGETAMHHAARLGNLSVVKCLLEEGADIDRKNFVDFTPLLYAAQNSHKDIVDLLLDSGANVDGSEGLLLYYASQNRWEKMVLSFVKKVPDLNKMFGISEAALNATSSIGHLDVVKCLVEEGTENNAMMICHAALHDASSMGHLEVVKWLVEKRPNMKRVLDLNARNKWGGTALLTALYREHLEVAKCLVEGGADVNRKDDYGSTALHVASVRGHLEMVKCLVENAADVNISDAFSETAVYRASSRGHLEIVKYLVEKGAVINTHNEFGDTVLHKASIEGHLDIVKYFTEKGTDFNMRNIHGFTPMLCATEYYQKDVVDLLMCCGANIDGVNRSKCTMLHMASAHGWLDTVQSLVKKGCDLDARDIQGITALGSACLTREFDTVQYLLKAGASWDIVDKDGDSPLNYLTRKKRPELELIKLFIDNGAYFKPLDYEAIVKNYSLNILQAKKLFCQSILNKFNYSDLSELYKLPASRSLPCIEKLRIASGSEVAQSIERTIEFEIQTKGPCNILEACPMALGAFSVRSILEYYKNKSSELKNQLKQPVVFDSRDRSSSNSMRLVKLNNNVHLSVAIKSSYFF